MTTAPAPVRIGDAVLYLGDCLEILPTLGPVDAVVTDPPYGIGVSLGVDSGKSDGGMWKDVEIKGDNSTEMRDAMLSIIGGIPFAILGSHKQPMPKGTQATLVWEKGNHVGCGDLAMPWKPNFELIFIRGSGFWTGHRDSGVLHFNAVGGCVGNRNDGRRFHPTEKPVELLQYLIQKSTGTILDPFMGSGTTGVACANLGRKFIGIEIEPRYFDIACERIRRAYEQPRLPLPEPEPVQGELL
jgi:DNA modification methylase